MRRAGPILVVLGVLAGLGRLVIDPSGLLVDADRPGVDAAVKPHARSPGNDLTRLFLPHHGRIAAEVAARGRPSAWDPFGFGGRPRVGNPQSGLFYLPVWVVWTFWSPSALGWLTAAHLVWGGLGAYALLGSRKTDLWPALSAGISYSCSAYVVSQTYEGHYPHIWSACWYPCIFWSTRAAADGRALGWIVLPVSLSMCFLAGHPQGWVLLMIALGCWSAWFGWRRRGAMGARRWIGGWAVVLMIHAAITAPEWLPDAMAARYGLRPPAVAEPVRYQVDLSNLLQVLSPRALGGRGDYIGRESHWETNLGLGTAGAGLLLIGLVGSARRREAVGWGLLLLATLVFAGGTRLGLHPLLCRVVPGLSRFRVPARSLFLGNLAMSMLIGLGVEAVGRASTRDARAWRGWAHGGSLLVVLIVIILATLSGVTPTRWTLGGRNIARDPSFGLGLATLCLGLTWMARAEGRGGYVAALLSIVFIGGLVVNNLDTLRVCPASRFRATDPIAGALPAGRYRIRALDTYYGDLPASLAGLEKTNANDSFQLGHAADLYETLYPQFEPPRPFVPDTPRARLVRQAVLDRMSVNYLVTDHPEPHVTWPILETGEWNSRRFLIYKNPGVMPRAYVVPRVSLTADDAQTVARMPEVDPRQFVLMPADPLPEGDRQPFTEARYTSTDPDRVVIRVETAAPGLLVVADTWMPGWSATLDGRPAEILRGNRAQRVVAIPGAGRHAVTMIYRPPGLDVGLALAAAGGVGWLILVVVLMKPRWRLPGGRIDGK